MRRASHAVAVLCATRRDVRPRRRGRRAAFVGFVGFAAFACLLSPGSARATDDPWFGRDKQKHFGASAIIAAGGYGAAAPFTESMTTRAIVGGSLAFTAGLAKEAWDLAGHGQPSWRDLTWDAVGTTVGVAVALAIDVVVRPRRPAEARAWRADGLVLRW